MTERKELGGDSTVKGLTASATGKADGAGLRVGIIHTRWNAEVVGALVEGTKAALAELGVAAADVITVDVPGSYELPLAAKFMAETGCVDAVVPIGVLIKGSTMHFEYICESTTQGIMRVGLDTGVPIVFGVLTCLTDEQAKARAGLTEGGHNHGSDWGSAAVEMALLKRNLSCGFATNLDQGEITLADMPSSWK